MYGPGCWEGGLQKTFDHSCYNYGSDVGQMDSHLGMVLGGSHFSVGSVEGHAVICSLIVRQGCRIFGEMFPNHGCNCPFTSAQTPTLILGLSV